MKRIKKASVIGITAALAISVFAGCSNKPESSPQASPSQPPAVQSPTKTESPSPAVQMTKADIQKALDAYGDSVIDIAWSPDNTMVAYIRYENETGNIYVWNTNNKDADLICKADNTTDGFLWAPDSKHFLINVGHMGPGTITSTLVDTESLKTIGTEITTVSISPPVWSPDGKYFVLSLDNQSTNEIEISVYDVTNGTQVSILKSNNKFGPYCVENWTGSTLKYTEMTSTGDRLERTIEVGNLSD